MSIVVVPNGHFLWKILFLVFTKVFGLSYLPNILSLPLSRLIINLLKCRIYQARTFVSCIYCVILRLWFVFFSNCKMFLTLWVWITINTQNVVIHLVIISKSSNPGTHCNADKQMQYKSRVSFICNADMRQKCVFFI